MIPAMVGLLLANGIWNLVVWPAFFRRIARDPRSRDAEGRRTRFFAVHAVLIAVSLLIGTASLVTAILALA